MKYIFFGPPGVGKGTYARRIAPKLGIVHISTGDIFREEVKKNSEIGKMAKSYMDRGDLVPDESVIKIFERRIKEPDAKNGYILDGFPRTVPQAKYLTEKGIGIDKIVNIYLPDEALVEILSGRRICRKCGDLYNVVNYQKGGINRPPMLPKKEGICDKCGGELYQRDDDMEKSIKDRLEVYKKQSSPVLDYYKKKGEVLDIVSENPPEVMVPRIYEMLKEKNK
ncbi:MAG: Adenylate kinase [uncultured bacterium]|nr:MAG: Adenylate kinase [uncultured bacterium]